jgi:hypothetical protein
MAFTTWLAMYGKGFKIVGTTIIEARRRMALNGAPEIAVYMLFEAVLGAVTQKISGRLPELGIPSSTVRIIEDFVSPGSSYRPGD